ncbi:MAG: 3-methyl-2-oxobutanoate hydroxymethyltransferase [Prevotella sp.]|jgi:3-methyl-2-oxobutanoate hydroxymethyltransferase
MSRYTISDNKKITVKRFKEMKQQGEKISMLTSYDYTTAGIIDRAGIDGILIGDSASNVMAGNSTTLPISMEEMLYYGRNVAHAVKRALVMFDMPFGSYQVSREDGIRNAIRAMKFTGCDAVKLEGGAEILDTVKGILDAGIPVCAHLGLTPQSVHKFSGFGLRAKEEAEAEKLLNDARLLDEAGCFAVVLEKIPAKLAAQVTKEVDMATIGIGGGNATDGQILVWTDAMGLTECFKPKFLRHFAQLGQALTEGVGDYVQAVKDGSFPNEEESY